MGHEAFLLFSCLAACEETTPVVGKGLGIDLNVLFYKGHGVKIKEVTPFPQQDLSIRYRVRVPESPRVICINCMHDV